MTTTSTTVSRFARGFVAASACWLVVWQVAAVVGVSRRAAITLGLYGFVFHTLFGKAYSLVPSYFDRTLAFPRGPAIQLPLTVAGVTALTVDAVANVPPVVGTAGAVAWAGGVAVFLGTLGWTVRDNLTGRETATGDHNAARRPIDRAANAVIPVALVYLAVGTYGLVAAELPLPVLVDGYGPRTSHLLAAGTAALFVFGVGFRLLPRFLVARPPRTLVAVVLPTGVVGPALLALGVPNGRLLPLGAAVEATAVVGFAVAILSLFRTTDRSRIGFYGVACGAVAGVLAVGFGAWFALAGIDGSLVVAHYRLALLGFLGLTIVGVAFQFYPPGIGRFPGAGDRLAGGVLAALFGGLLGEVTGVATSVDVVALGGRVLALVGALGYAYLLVGLFVQRARE